jgi:glyoxylase-like metal-dependent hydrolase (beta-lactamase superfamily II)
MSLESSKPGEATSEVVTPSNLGAQPVGEAAEVAEGIYQLKVPVPFPLVFVSVYLVKGDDGWTILDTGFDYPEGREAWETGARQVGLDLDRDVTRIFVTHFHPDHLGMAHWLQERSRAPVYMLESEIRHSREVWGAPDPSLFVEHQIRNGMDRTTAERAAARIRAKLVLPEEVLPLRDGEEVKLGVGAARVMHSPGHADHQILLHDEERKVLFAADHVMLGITPNIGLWPESEPQPLARYLKSISGLRDLDADLVLPGHGPLFHDLGGRIDELLRHHEERLELMRGILGDEPQTPFAVSRVVFRYALSLYERCFALAETLAHLEHLAMMGRAERIEDGGVAFRGT